MAYSHKQIVQRFTDGKTKGRSSSMYIEEHVLYSFGSHFPLLVKTPFGYLMNADKYSSSTSNHQSHCFRIATVMIPFSILRAANIPNGTWIGYKTEDGEPEQRIFNLIDNTPEVWELKGAHKNALECKDCAHKTIQYSCGDCKYINDWSYDKRPKDCYRWDDTRNDCHKKQPDGFTCGLPYKEQQRYCKQVRISAAEYEKLTEDEQGKWQKIEERHPSGCVIEHGGSYYLSSTDTSAKRLDYFMVKLPCPVSTVAEAYEVLIPEQVKGKKYVRQGEWFFVEDTDTENPKRTYKEMNAPFRMPLQNDSSNPHTATRGFLTNDGSIKVSGAVDHREHGRLRLSKADNPKIFTAFVNTAVASWSAGGKVD